MSGQVRNIQQSLQDRDVTKQCPDVVCFIDGQNYLNNPFLGTEPGVRVPFNDYLSSFEVSYDVDALVPSGSVTLVVPNSADHQFRTPGGNNLLTTMSDIRVYGKGYYLSPEGNTVYHQIFRGFITSVNYNIDGKHTIISISCAGAMGLLERMQVDMAPSRMAYAAQEVTPFTSTCWNLGPIDQIAWVFLYGSMLDGFDQMVSLRQRHFDPTQPFHAAVAAGMAAMWQPLLYDLARDVHIFGKPNVTDVLTSIRLATAHPETANEPYSKSVMAIARDRVGKLSPSDASAADMLYTEQLRGYLPDHGWGNIQPLNSKVTSRLERLNYLTKLIGFEAYQDIDGGIIFKPPLYNLDVLNISNPNDPAFDSKLLDLYGKNNPFVVQLAEILAESETEDESAVRATRVIVRGSLSPGWQVPGTETVLAVAEEFDIPKMAQFGLRMEPPIEAPWFRDGDSKGQHGYAALELARANRAFRTYSLTIPLRPELKLGFPMYLPHRDMYGYIKGVTISYTQGSNATMSVLLDCLRRRPMFPKVQGVLQVDKTTVQTTTLTTQPNLIMQWTAAPTSVTPPPPAELAGRLATLPVPLAQVFSQEIQMQHYREKKISNSIGPNPDSTTHNWRVQPDTQGIFEAQRKVESAPSDTPKTAMNDYFAALQQYRPYTDGKGYEVISPYPLGRWDSLKNALYNFTIQNSLASGAASAVVANVAGVPTALLTPISSTPTPLSNAQAFLFTGSAAPSSSPDAASALTDALITQTSKLGSFKVIELTYDATNTASTVGGLQSMTDQGGVVDDSITAVDSRISGRVEAFLTGNVPQPSSATTVLRRVTANGSATNTGESAAVLQRITVNPPE
jgi:hypothetical protein